MVEISPNGNPAPEESSRLSQESLPDFRSKSTPQLTENLEAALPGFPSLANALKTLPEIVGYIEADTGWSLDVSKLTFEIADRSEVVKIATQDAASRLGYTVEELAAKGESPNGLWNRFQSWVQRQALEKGIGALYLPSEDKVVFVRENLQGANEQGLRKVVFHELIHAAQEQRHEGMFRSIGALTRQSIEIAETRGKDSPEYLDVIDTVNARMALIEGQPTYLQEAKTKERFPGATVGTGLSSFAVGMLAMLNRESWAKIAQYIKGKQAFEQIYKHEPELVDLLFEKPLLADVVLKSRGEITIPLKADVSDEAVEEIAKQVITLASFNRSRGGVSINITKEAPVKDGTDG